MIDEGMVVDFRKWLTERIDERVKEAEEHKENGMSWAYYVSIIEGATLAAVLDEFEEAMGWKAK